MQVGILGPLEVRAADGRPVEVGGARLRALLSRLALDAGRPVPAGALVDAVWDERPPAEAANALQTLVSRLRRALGDGALVAQSAAGYRLAVDPDDVDAHRFEVLAVEGRALLRDGDPAGAARLLRDALALWRGPALVDAGPAAQPAAARLDEQRLAALVDRIEADVACGRADAVVAELDALCDEHPLDERLAARLITTLATAGRQADALSAFERTRARLADELGVDPSADLRAAHLAVLRGEIDRPAEPPVRRTNLKAQLSSFVGREEDVRRVQKALADNRLVTLVGPGGAGKTRLATEAGAALTPADGVWLAELAPLTDGADIAQTVLAALGFRESQLIERHAPRAGRDAETRLIDVLAERDAVLVLDNCEHIVDDSAHLAEFLLGHCPRVRVLATSREPLGLIGEVVLAVPALGAPASGDRAVPAITASAARDYPAVRLFADRAAAVRPEFVLDDHNVASVVEIVRRLDGLPLAIELAAARSRTMPLADLAARLSDRFRLLTGGSRTALPRHRTLQAVVEWSWELLGAPEQRLAERLCVFTAGVTAESALAVAGVDVAEDEPEMADLLGSLVDKSLLQRVGDGSRLRMLETIREFGAQRLGERGELTDVRRRHADYFADLLKRAEPYLLTRDQLPWIELVSAERDNILAALRFRCDDQDADGALLVACGLAGTSMLLGNHSDITGWMREALAVPGATDEQLVWAATSIYAMNVASTGSRADEIDDGMKSLKEASEHLDDLASSTNPVFGIVRIAVAFFSGNVAATRKVLAEQLARPDEWSRAAAHMFRANLSENEGDVDGMREDVAAALTAFRRLGDRWGLANTLRLVALLHTLDGDLAAAESAYEEALLLMGELKSREDEAFLLVRVADLAVRQGDVDRARALVSQASRSAEESGSSPESVFTLTMLAEIERQAGNVARSRELYEDARTRIAMLPTGHPGQAHERAMVSGIGARFALADGDVALARSLAHDAFAAAVATKDRPIEAAIGVVIARIAAGSGRPADAAEVLGAAARLRGADDRTSRDIRELYDRLVSALGAEEADRCYARGKALDRAAASARIDPAVSMADPVA